MLFSAQHDAAIRMLLNRGDLVVPDGHGILWAGERLGCPFPERVTGIDLIQALAVRGAGAGWRLYLLGGAPGVAEAAAVNLQRQHPGLQVVGTSHGYFTRAELPAVLDRIRAAGPDLLLVGMGFPRQEHFIRDNRHDLGRLVAIGAGGSFDVISGKLRRSPVWIQRLRLEWLYRAFQEPARWQRLMVLPRFMGMVLTARRSKA
jgi:N-acetylglucosaminyldiphosphoundecaprenol N-acetyl-beta-D-mannosaminyltransferase